MIIGFMDDPVGWRQCALVCRSWTHASRLHLFRDINITIGEFNVPPVIRLQAVIMRSPYLARQVRTLTLRRDCSEYFPSDTQEQLISIMLPLFIHVQTFSYILDAEDGPELEFVIDPLLRTAIGAFLRSSHIKHVDLSGLTFYNLEDFMNLMGETVAALSTLHIQHICILNETRPSTRPITKRGSPVTLDTLTVVRPEDVVEHWLDSLSHPLVVKKLVLRGYGPTGFLISRLCDGLEELCIHVGFGSSSLSACAYPDSVTLDPAPFFDFSRLKYLLKLTLGYTFDTLYDILQATVEDNRLESLDLHILEWDFSMDTPRFSLLDDLLSSTRFPCLQQVTLRIERDSYDTSEFKLLRKRLRLTIGKNLLYLRFRTGETLHSSQIRDQASRREWFLLSDFPWFLEELQVVEALQDASAQRMKVIDEAERGQVEEEDIIDEDQEENGSEGDDAEEEDESDSGDLPPSSAASKGKGKADPADSAETDVPNGGDGQSPQVSAPWNPSHQQTDDSNYVYYGSAEQPAYLVAQEYDANNDPTSHQYASSSQVTLEAFYPQQTHATDNDAEQAYTPAPQTQPTPSELTPLDAPYQQEHYGWTANTWSGNADTQSSDATGLNSVYYYPETAYPGQPDSQSTSQPQSTYSAPQCSSSTSSSNTTYADAPEVVSYGIGYPQTDWSASNGLQLNTAPGSGDIPTPYHQYPTQSNAASTSFSNAQWTSSDSSYPSAASAAWTPSSYHPVSHTENDDNGINGSTWNRSHHAVASTTASAGSDTYSRETGGYQGHYSMAQSSGMADNWASTSGSQQVYSTSPSGDPQQALHSYQQNDHSQYDHYGNTTQAHQEQPMSAYQYQYGHDSNSKDAHQPSTTHQPSIETSVSSAPVSYFIPQPQFQSVPQIPTPSNPSYYKRSFEFVENSLLTKVREVVTRSPYQRQVYFSQTLAPDTSYQPQSGR
ncbi:hypothetical protein ONZ45_g6908 [Pleurotus djamor]|nr:hypothetical protein ONZ45_g6908 [Pleurotus djamor]